MDTNPVAPLVERALAGDQDAWDAIVTRYSGLVWTTVRGFGMDPQTAADVVQATWLRLVERLDRVREPDALGSWLVTTARRECIDALRRSRRQPAPMEWFDHREPADEGPPPDADLVAAARDAMLCDALLAISERCRELLLMLVADPEPSYQQVSAELDMPVGSIGPTRGRCLDRLRAELERRGADVELLTAGAGGGA